MRIEISHDTILKPNTEQASLLPSDQVVAVKAGTTFPVLGYRTENGHIKFTIDPDAFDLKNLHPSAKNTWFAYLGHVEDSSGFSEKNNPQDKAPITGDRKGVRFNLPGYTSQFWSTDPVSPKTPSFTWSEALHFNGENYRKPDNRQQVENIIRIAQTLEFVKKKFDGRPIIIRSWLRPQAINDAVGGAKNSAHIDGFGVDFIIPGYTPNQIFQMLDDWHGVNGGLARSNRHEFVHIDLKWPGVRRRWYYPGG
jgi:hypothetical protein